MEKIFKQALLYDFYGELLTQHQRSIYEDAVYNDMSLGEIAQEYGISRQGVHDLIKRCDKILQEYEDKLQLVDKFTRAKDKIGKILELVEELEPMDADEESGMKLAQIKQVSSELMKEF
jgi:predicted DNA-binding protein YlxM (UPF0122 family)